MKADQIEKYLARDKFFKKYPELDKIAKIYADEIYTEIGKRTSKIDSKMPYKAQYVLEELIKHLEKAV